MKEIISIIDQPFQAIAFDFDGTLIDTLPLHFEAYRKVFESVNLELTFDDFYQNIGGKAAETIPLFLRGRHTTLTIEEIHSRKKDEIATLFQHASLKILPTARMLPLIVGQLPLALVSAGSKPGILQLLERLNWLNFFDVIITGEDTLKSKPDPAPYLLAAKRLGIEPGSIAVFEDTSSGLQSAKAAGMSIFDVSANNFPPCP